MIDLIKNKYILLLLLVVFCVAPQVQAQETRDKKGIIDTKRPMSTKQPTNAERQLRQRVMRVGTSVYLFRLAAMKSPARALERMSTPECWKNWMKMIPRLGISGLSDFFEGAVFFIGRVEEQNSVIMFYNPWLDAVLLSEWGYVKTETKDKAVQNSLRIKSFVWCTGETWRNEHLPTDTKQAGFPAWKRKDTFLLASFNRTFADTARVFDVNYSVKDKFLFLIPRLVTLKSDDAERREIPAIRKRMDDKKYSFLSFAKSPKGSDAALMGHLGSRIRKLIVSGSQDAVKTLIAGNQDKKTLDIIFGSSVKHRSRLKYCPVIQKGKNIKITLAAPTSPDGIVFLNLTTENGKPELVNIEVTRLMQYRTNPKK